MSKSLWVALGLKSELLGGAALPALQELKRFWGGVKELSGGAALSALRLKPERMAGFSRRGKRIST